VDTKGTDTSHLNDEENPNIVEYSDDEEERLAKKAKDKMPQELVSQIPNEGRLDRLWSPDILTGSHPCPELFLCNKIHSY
jgi:hypothetical protein